MAYDPLVWMRERIARPTYRRVYKPYIDPHIKRIRTTALRVRQEAKQYVPTVSYKRAAERRKRVVDIVKPKRRKPPAPVGFQEKIVSQKATALRNLESQYTKTGRITPTGEFLPTSTINVERKYARDITPTGEFKTTHTDVVINKWASSIRGQNFIGTKEQFTHYQSEFNVAQQKDKARYNAYKKDWSVAQQADKKVYGAYQSKYKEYESERTKLATLKAEKRKELKEFVTYPIYKETAEFGRWWEETIVPKGLRLETPTPIKPLAKFGVGLIRSPGQVISFFGMVPSAVEYAARDADEFAVSLAPGAVVAGKSMVKHAKEEPIEFAGETVGMLGLTYGVGKVVKVMPVRPGVGVARLPHADAVALGLKVQKGAYTEFYPAITLAKGKAIKPISLGKPKIKGEVFGEVPVEIRTPLEVGIAKRAVPAEALKITEARGVRYYTVRAGVKPKKLTPIIEETLRQHGLKKSTQVTVRLLKEEKADLYGSVMQKAAGKEVGEVGLGRTPRDFDVKVPNPETFAKIAVKRINKAEGRTAVVLKDGKVIVKKTGEKLFDIHLKEEYGIPGLGEEYIGYGMREEPLIKTAEGIRTTTLSRQATRKLTAAQEITAMERELVTEMGLRVKGRIAPEHAGRVKDIADYYFAEKANIAGLRLKHKPRAAKLAGEHLEKWLESWGKEVKKHVKDLYAKTVKSEGGEKAWLGSYEKAPSSPSKSYKMVSQLSYIPAVSALPSAVSAVPSEISDLSAISRVGGIGSRISSDISKIDSKVSGISELNKIESRISKDISKIDSKVSSIPSKPSYTPPSYPPSPTPSKLPFYEVPFVEIVPYLPPSRPPTKPLLKLKKKDKKRLTIEEELEAIYRKRKYPTLTPSEMLRM